MTKAKDIARAKAGQAHVSGNGGVPEGKQLIKCQYPPCNTKIVVNNIAPGMPYKGLPPFCPLHLEMLNFYMWCVTMVKIEKQQTPHGIVLPGHEQFQASLKNQK